jgi:hypothetical protein
MIGQSKMKERLADMTPSRMLLDVNVSPQKKERKKRYNKHLILRWYHTLQVKFDLLI